jgi:hypothetical protein
MAAASARLENLEKPLSGLLLGASAAETARAARYQRARPEEMVVPTEGPSWQQVACIVATTLIGAGVLGLPYAMRMSGWAGLLLILTTTCITAYTAKMLVWSFTEINERKLREQSGTGAGVRFVATYDHLAEEVCLPAVEFGGLSKPLGKAAWQSRSLC